MGQLQIALAVRDRGGSASSAAGADRRLKEIEFGGEDFIALPSLVLSERRAATLSQATDGVLDRSERHREIMGPHGFGSRPTRSSQRPHTALDGRDREYGPPRIRQLRSRPTLDNILTCRTAGVVVRVSTRRGGRTIQLAKADKTFKYCCVGRSTHRLTLTTNGRRILAQSRRLRILVTVRLFDGEGGSVQRSRRMTVGKARPAFG